MNWEAIDTKLKELSSNEVLKLTDLNNAIDEMDKRMSEEAEIYGEVAEYFDKITSDALERVKSKKSKGHYEKMLRNLAGYSEKYNHQWKSQADAYKGYIKKIRSVRGSAEELIKTLEEFSKKYGECKTFIVEKKYGKIEDDKMPSKYEEKCMKECDKELCEAFDVSSIAELKKLLK